MLGSAGWLLGFKTLTGDVFMTAACIGVVATALAGYLSWKSLSFGLNFVGGGFFSGPKLTKAFNKIEKEGSSGSKSGGTSSSKGSSTSGSGGGNSPRKSPPPLGI